MTGAYSQFEVDTIIFIDLDIKYIKVQNNDILS